MTVTSTCLARVHRNMPDSAPYKDVRCASRADCRGLVRFGRGRFMVPLCAQHLHTLLEHGDSQGLAKAWCMAALYDELAAV